MERFTADELRQHTVDLGMTNAEAGVYIEDHIEAQEAAAEAAEADYLMREAAGEP